MILLPVADLRERLGLGRARGGGLLTRDEQVVLDRILALEGAPALLHARLTARRPVAFRLPDLVCAGVDDVAAAADALVVAGLADGEVPWADRLAEAPRAVLAQGCRRLGLPVGGSRPVLQGRLAGREGWDEAPWLRLPHAGLVLRLERWATLEVAPDRSVPVLERLGRLRWVDYPLTDGGGLVPTREDWLAWEALVTGWDALTPDELLAALERTAWPPGRLDLRRALVARVLEEARAHARAGRLEQAERLHEGLHQRGFGSGEVVVGRARLRERRGDPAGALGLLLDARHHLGGAERLALGRAGRRLARRLGRAWAPDPPLAALVERTLRLQRVEGEGPRPRYAGAGEDLTVERAVAARVEAHGRRVLPGEGRLWRTVVGLLLADATFLAIPGQLPAPRLAGPLDAWTPAFAARRPQAVQRVLDEVEAGRAGALVEAAHERLHGCVVAGIDWERASRADLVALVEGLPPAGLRAILRAFLREGRRAAAGLPDLVLLPGAPLRLAEAHPSRVGEGVLLVEVKGEHDDVRDAQRVWLDRLVRAGVAAEVWRVTTG